MCVCVCVCVGGGGGGGGGGGEGGIVRVVKSDKLNNKHAICYLYSWANCLLSRSKSWATTTVTNNTATPTT